MAVRDELHHLVDQLPDGDAAEALDYVRWLSSDGETLSSDELDAVRTGEEQIVRGEYVTLDELARSRRE